MYLTAEDTEGTELKRNADGRRLKDCESLSYIRFPLRESVFICVLMNHRLSFLSVREALLLKHFPLNKCKV